MPLLYLSVPCFLTILLNNSLGIKLVICEKSDNFTIGIGFCRYCKITPSWGISNPYFFYSKFILDGCDLCIRIFWISLKIFYEAMDFLTPLTYKSVILINKKYPTDGHSPFLVITEDYEQYVLKTPNNLHDKYAIMKEFLCSYLLSSWEIWSPDTIALVLHPDLLASEIIAKERSFLYSSVYFGSKYIKNSVDSQSLISAKNQVSFRKIKNPFDLLNIALFDIWVENDDRKPSNHNLLLCPLEKGLRITPIDHAYTFASIPFLQLISDDVCFSDNDSILYSSIGNEIVKKVKMNRKWHSETKEKFYLCIEKAQNSFQQLCNNVPIELGLTIPEVQQLEFFLFNKKRNQRVFELFNSILNHVKK